MSIEEMAKYEEHFFTCAECAAEVASDSLFAETVRDVFQDEARAAVEARNQKVHWWQGWFDLRIPLALAASLLLAVVIYQNFLVIPKLEQNVALLSGPQSPFPVVLQLARDETVVTKVPKEYVFFNPQFFRAFSGQLPSYVCDIENGSGTKVKSVVLAAPADGDPFSFKLLRSEFPSGMYRFKLRGPDSSKILATYTIVLNTD